MQTVVTGWSLSAGRGLPEAEEEPETLPLG